MAVKRVQITLQEELLNKLDNMAKAKGMTRSAMLQMLINQATYTDELTVTQILEVIENDDRFQQVIKQLANQ